MTIRDKFRSNLLTPNPKLWKTSLALLLFAAVCVIFAGSIANIDLWVHLKAGLDNLANQALARQDPYSYLTQGQEWINNDWLSQILLAIAWSWGHTLGLTTLKLILGILTVGIVYWNFMLQRVDPLLSGWIIFIGSILLASDFSTIYPQIFTLPLFAFLLFIIIQAEAGFLRWLWAAPVVFLVWVNVHGGFLLGLYMFFLWSMLHLIQDWQNWKKILAPVGVSLVATFFNPFGYSLYQYLLHSTHEMRPEIWLRNSLVVYSPFGIIYMFVLVLSVIGFVYSRRYRSPALIILFGIGAIMPFVARRFLSISAITAMMIAGEHIADVLKRAKWIRAQANGVPSWVSILTMVVAVAFIILALPNLGHISITQSPPYPVQAIQIIKQSGVKGNLALEYNWGGYAIWHLAPNVKVSTDGRRDAVYSPDIFEQNMSFLLGIGEWDSLLKNHPTDMVLINDHSPVFNLMKLIPGWVLIYRGQGSDLYVRQGSALETPLRETAQQFKPVEDIGFFP